VKRIFICFLNDTWAGAEQILKMIAVYYSKTGYAVDIFYLTKQKTGFLKDIEDKASLYYTKSEYHLNGFMKLFKNIRKSNHEYVYGFTSHIYTTSFIGFLRKLKLIKMKYLVGRDNITYYSGGDKIRRFFWHILLNIGYSHLDLLICQTDRMRDELMLNKKRLAQKICIRTIRNPVDFEFLQSINNLFDPINKISEKYIIAAGRLVRKKGFDVLIKSFKQLLMDDYILLILGEGKERQNLERLISELRLENNVRLLGYVDNVYPYFKNAELCVISTSGVEGFPNVLLQMMSQNTKIVSTKCAGDIEDINGIFTCESNNIDALSFAMKKCLLSDTQNNRLLFDEELEKRSIVSFITQIEQICSEHEKNK
jgi:glycosyltransferase involved in cell wall biosynthesis